MTESNKASAAKSAPAPASFLEQALVNPEKHFQAPSQVLAYAGFRDDQKRRVLEAWEASEKRLLESSTEGMDQPSPNEPAVVGTRSSRLSEVQAALRELEQAQQSRH